METVRPNKSDPIAGENPHGIGTILLRFVCLLAVAVAIMAIVWRR